MGELVWNGGEGQPRKTWREGDAVGEAELRMNGIRNQNGSVHGGRSPLRHPCASHHRSKPPGKQEQNKSDLKTYFTRFRFEPFFVNATSRLPLLTNGRGRVHRRAEGRAGRRAPVRRGPPGARPRAAAAADRAGGRRPTES